jgi:hypothetical protein
MTTAGIHPPRRYAPPLLGGDLGTGANLMGKERAGLIDDRV